MLQQFEVLIRAKHRERCFAMDQRKRLHLALGSFLRLMLGWRKDIPEAQRKAIAAEAAKMIENGDGPWADVIAANAVASGHFEKLEDDAKKAMARLAKQLPVWESFGAGVRGFGEVSFAVIIAEAGDLSLYANPGKLWKRMGLAAGQNRVPPGLGREQRAAAWIERGYNPRRRSHVWNIGDALIKGNQDGPYRTIYLQRKEYELARNPEMTKMHAHRRAQRYMEKRLLRDLWQAWRRASKCSETGQTMPSAEIPQAESGMLSERGLPAEQRASRREKPISGLPSAPIKNPQAREIVKSISLLPAEQRAMVNV